MSESTVGDVIKLLKEPKNITIPKEMLEELKEKFNIKVKLNGKRWFLESIEPKFSDEPIVIPYEQEEAPATPRSGMAHIPAIPVLKERSTQGLGSDKAVGRVEGWNECVNYVNSHLKN